MSNSEDILPPEALVPVTEETEERVRLNITGAHPFTEIRVLDASFQPLALSANTGSVELEVTPGLYEVGFRVDERWESQHVMAEPGASEIAVQQPVEAAPVAESARAEMLACAAEAGPAHDGATIIVSLRASDGEGDGGNPAGILVTLIDAAAGVEVHADLSPELPNIWRFSAPPGFWRLRINEAHPRHPFEMPITVVPDYVVHIAAMVRPGDEGLCVDLERLRVRLLRPEGWETMDDVMVGFEEAAIAALSSGRSLYGPDLGRLIDGLVDDKTLNPMLGIFAAHLCEQTHDDDLTFRERLLDRLAHLTGAPAVAHPDVAILRLAFLIRNGRSIEGEPPVLFPPMLAASWRTLLETAAREPRLIPAGSLCERVADRLWSSSLWTAWTAPPLEAEAATSFSASADPPAAPQSDHDVALQGETIAALLDHVEIRERFREVSASAAQDEGGLSWDVPEGVTPAEAAVASALYPLAEDEERQSHWSRLAEKHVQLGTPETVDPEAMAAQLGLPKATVERSLGSLAGKLGAMASDLNIEI